MSAEAQGRDRAAGFRRQHALGDAPLGDLVALIDQIQGIDVAILDAGPDEHGMTVRDPLRGVVMVAAARTRRPMRQRSTLAHELGHVLFGDYAPPKGNGWSDRSPEEIRADAFARHLLVPMAGIAAVVGKTRPLVLSDLSKLVQWFQASPALVTIQLTSGGFIDEDQKREWMSASTPALATRFGWSDQYRAWQAESDSHRAPQRLLTRATEGYIANAVSLTAIARLRGTSIPQVERDFAAAGITPSEEPIAWASPDDLPKGMDDFSDLDALDETDSG